MFQRYIFLLKSTNSCIADGRLNSAMRPSSRKRSANPFYTTEKNVYAQIAILGMGTVFVSILIYLLPLLIHVI